MKFNKLTQPIQGTEKYNLKPAIILLSIGAVLLAGYLIYGFATLPAPTTANYCYGNYISADGTYCDGNGHGGQADKVITENPDGSTTTTYVKPQ